jgi:glutathione S-transferase/GST-like protein
MPSPNGQKVSIALEEMGLPYEVVIIDILAGEQTDPEYLKLCPNGRIPALVEQDAHGERVVVFESGAILQYLGRKSGQYYPAREALRAQVDSWVHWQMAGLGPMASQVNWFKRVSEVPGRDTRDSSYALHRFTREVKRLYGVLDRQLARRDYICDQYSIADMASWPWVHKYHWHVGELAEYANVVAWHARIAARPAVQRALRVGMPATSASG